MKRYISAILIPCLLLQLFGCYSSREITVDELKEFDNALIITKDSTVYHLSEKVNKYDMTNKPNEYFSDYWIVNKDNSKIDLVAQRSSSKKVNDLVERKTITGKKSIPFNEISIMSVEEFNTGKTCLTGGLAILGIGSVVLLAMAAAFKTTRK